MKLSMWIVYEWLKEYRPEAHIQEGQQTISGVRYMADDLELSKEYLYIGYSDAYIDQLSNNVICVNGSDLIILSAPDIYVIFNEIQQMLEYYNSWETSLLQAMNGEEDLSYYLSSTVSVMKTGLAVSDLSHKVLCHVEYQDRPEKLQLHGGYLELEEMRLVNRQMQEHVGSHEPYLVHSSQGKDILYNIYNRSNRLAGSIISLSGGEDGNILARMQLISVFGNLMNLWFRLHEDVLTEMTLFRDVLEMKETDPEVIAIRLQGMGWDVHPPMQMILIRPCGSVTMGIPFVIRFLEEQYPFVRSIRYQDADLLIVNYRMTDREQFQKELIRLTERQMAYCGCSHEFTDLNHLMQNYMQASFAADYGNHAAGSLNRCEDYVLEYMKDKFREAIDADLAAPALEILRVHDAEHGTDYYRTLYEYLLCERNQTLTAQKLFIHRNSLIYRIGRIEEIIGTDLNDERERLYLLLSFLAYENKEEVQ